MTSENKYHAMTTGTINSGYGTLRWRLGTGGVCEIADVTVDPHHKREGEGRYLLCLLFREMDQPYYKVHTVYAFCRKENRIAVEWYIACGFKPTELPGFYGDGPDGDALMFTTRTPT